MPSLLAIVAPTGPAFVDALRRAWDGGHAVLPVDPRLPRPAVDALLAATEPAALIDERGVRHDRTGGGRPVEEGDALVVATSGTTGEPKAAVLTMAAVRAAAEATSARLGVDPARDVWLACLPLAHVGGLGVVTRALLTATPLVAKPGYEPTPEATLVSLVPTLLARHDVSAFRAVLLGGSAPPDGLPTNVVTTYGLTETGGGVVYDGRPLEGVEVRIASGSGEIALRGPSLLRGYRDGSDPKTAAGWLPTGDAGHLDEVGRLHVDGRLDDAITTGGETVWPAAIERVILSHPDVAEVAVAGRPDPEWGERVVAYVVAGASTPALAALRDHVSQFLPAYCAPRELVVVRALPRTTIGKVRRADLPVHC